MVFDPLGFTVPFRVTPVLLMALAVPVTTVGVVAIGVGLGVAGVGVDVGVVDAVVNVASELLDPPPELVATMM
jgi:hypothetical protein